MESILRMSDSAASYALPASSNLPSPLTTLIHLMNRVHWLRRWKLQVSEVYMNSRHLKLLGVGYLTRELVGESALLGISAQIILVTSRTIDLGKQKVRTYDAYCDVLHAIFTSESHWVRVHVPRDKPTLILKFLGDDLYIWVIQKKEAFLFYVRRVGISTGRLFKEMFNTSMCYMDVIEAFSVNATTNNDAVNHLFINTAKLLDDISENKQTIHAVLCKHEMLIQQILGVMGTKYQAKTLIKEVAKTLDTAERTYNGVQWVFNKTESSLLDGASSLCLSLLGYTPACLVPENSNPLKGFSLQPDVAASA